MSDENRDGPVATTKRVLVGMGVIGIASIIIAFVFYAVFHWNNQFTTEPGAWGQFGDFIGGTLNPIIGALGVIGLLWTIYQNQIELAATRKQLEKSADALEQQKDIYLQQEIRLKNESTKSDLYRVIELANKELNAGLDKPIKFAPPDNFYLITVRQLFGADKSEQHYNEIADKNDESDIGAKSAICSFSELLTELGIYISKYRAHGGDSSLSTYFAMRYGIYAMNLYQKGYIEEKIKNTFIFP